VPELERVLEDPATSIDAKKLVLRVASDIGTPKTVETLFTSALGPNLVLRFIAIKALNRLRKHDGLLFSRHMAVSLLEQELRALQVELERAEFIAPRTGSLMDSLLNQRQFWALQRIFRVLGLLYDPKAIYNAYLAVTSNDHRRADAALEFLDATLSPEHRKPLLHLLETQQLQHRVYDRYARKSMLFSYLGARDDLPASAMIADLTDEEFDLWKDEIRQGLQTFPNLPMVEETFRWRCGKMQPVDNVKRKLTTIEKLESLNRIDIFSRLGPQELLLIANQCDVVEFSAGESIYSEGQSAHEIYALISGKVDLFRGSSLVAKINQGESFGTLSVLSSQPRLLSARALENSVCLKIDAENFWDVLEDYPAIIQQVLKLLTQQLRIVAEPAQPLKVR
ncbi:MAG TPA: cyclic nucleotide-binding domain-containing protein, partial [Acidobacteriota bacterium]